MAVSGPLLFNPLDPFGSIADLLKESMGELFKDFFTWWLAVPFSSVRGGSGTSPTEMLQGELFPVVALVAAGGIIAAAARLALTRKVDPMLSLVKGIVTLVVVTFAGLVIVDQLLAASDALALQILDLDSETAKSLGTRLTVVFTVAYASNPALFSLLALLVIILGVVQMILMLLREGSIILLAGALPLAAVGTMIPGTNWFRKVSSWMLAFIFYKPAAALVYLGAFALISDSTGGPMHQIKQFHIGLIMLVLAIFVLPMLMKLFDWTTGHAAGGDAGAMVGGAMGGVVGSATANFGLNQMQSEQSGAGGGAQGQANMLASNLGQPGPAAGAAGGGGAAGGAAAAGGPAGLGALYILQGAQQMAETAQKTMQGAAGAMGPPEDAPPSNKQTGD